MKAAEARELARAVIARLRQHTNPERKEFTEGYFPSQWENLGVAVPDLRRELRWTRRELKGRVAAQVLDVARAILKERTLEGRQLAYELVGGFPGMLPVLDAESIEELGQGMDAWVSVDAFATTISGQAWREGRLSDARIVSWTRSPDRWWRRAAVVSTVPLNLASRGGTGDVPRTLRICAAVATDADEMVSKGLSWALRSAIEHDPEEIQRFLARHAEGLRALVRREVTNKLESGKKNPGRRKKA